MAVRNAMFIFEVVVSKVESFVHSRHLVIRSEFADVFSLELKDPKTMHIVIPEPPPPPPAPPGKKGKKPPKPKKPKKGKKGAVAPPPPPEPDIQSGQSVLFTSNAEFLVQNMKKFPMEVSLWSKEDYYVYIGSTIVPWDPLFYSFLNKIMNCQEPPPLEVRDDYNVFEEGTAKIIAKLGIKITIRYLTERVTSSFRSLSEDPEVHKFLYTGMNNRVTSFMCIMKTTDEDFDKNANKIENSYIKDRPEKPKPIVYADYKNAPGANVLHIGDARECCEKNAEKPPDSKYKVPETCPDIEFIDNYVRNIIISCNDAMRMLTPRPTIHPRFRATDIDRLCYCRETSWPEGKLAELFRKEVQGPPCPICTDAGKMKTGKYANTFDLACVRGPCGSTECKVAREVRGFIEKQVVEDTQVLDLKDLIGPCGSKECSLVKQITNFLRHRGAFEHSVHTQEGLSTQCACIEQMQNALKKRDSCSSVCSVDCEEVDSDKVCSGPGCPYKADDEPDTCQETACPDQGPGKNPQVYQVYYFTVEYDDTPPNTTPTSPTKSTASSPTPPTSKSPSRNASIVTFSSGKSPSPPSQAPAAPTPQLTPADTGTTPEATKFKYCSADCPSNKQLPCSKSLCFPGVDAPSSALLRKSESEKCVTPVCPTWSDTILKESPPDSHVMIRMADIHNPCCVKDCTVAKTVKDFIMEGLEAKATLRESMNPDNPCFCDCSCNFKFTKQTTYCPVCGGYEAMGDDARALPEFKRPHPCPVYHKLYDRKYIKTKRPFSDEEEATQQQDAVSTKSGRTTASKGPCSNKGSGGSDKSGKKKKKSKKVTGKGDGEPGPNRHRIVCIAPYVPVPKNMGWNWKAEDAPGLKYRPLWRPGCALRRLVRRYREMQEPLSSILAKKQRALLAKRPERPKKPTIVVTKKDGEYNVMMEVFKKYSRERLVHQYPYDDTKPPLIYTIGKTEEEKEKIQKQKERRERRTNRRKCRLIQSAFRDKCQEICVKAYNQAIGLLPLPNPNNPDCPCAVETVRTPSPVVDSCSCSEAETVTSSDTDGDDWVVEFTAPAALYEPKAKHPLRPVDHDTQYSYLDYRVKLLDRHGNQIPRFFKGPDGTQQCSDLGAFLAPDGKTWLVINKDGFIGPDNRWAPLNFYGPDGMTYTAEDGYFIDGSGKQLKIGVDGWIDANSKWVWYRGGRLKGAKSTSTATTMDAKKKAAPETKKPRPLPRGKDAPGKRAASASSRGSKIAKKPPVVVSPPSKMKKIMLPPGVRAKMHKCQLYMARMNKRGLGGQQLPTMPAARYIDTNVSKYNEIMRDLNMYDELFETKQPPTAHRACMTTKPGPDQASVSAAIEQPPPPPPTRIRMNTLIHPRVRPIDSMKIRRMESLRTSNTKPAYSSRSGLQTTASFDSNHRR